VLGVSRKVYYGEDPDPIRLETEEHAVRESLHEGSAKIPVDHRETERVFENA
jgi:hypothetical protein